MFKKVYSHLVLIFVGAGQYHINLFGRFVIWKFFNQSPSNFCGKSTEGMFRLRTEVALFKAAANFDQRGLKQGNQEV